VLLERQTGMRRENDVESRGRMMEGAGVGAAKRELLKRPLHRPRWKQILHFLRDPGFLDETMSILSRPRLAPRMPSPKKMRRS